MSFTGWKIRRRACTHWWKSGDRIGRTASGRAHLRPLASRPRPHNTTFREAKNSSQARVARLYNQGEAMRHGVLLALSGLLLLKGASATAQEHRFEIAPFAGYETSGSYPVRTSFTVDRLRANGNVSFGTFLDYSL